MQRSLSRGFGFLLNGIKAEICLRCHSDGCLLCLFETGSEGRGETEISEPNTRKTPSNHPPTLLSRPSAASQISLPTFSPARLMTELENTKTLEQTLQKRSPGSAKVLPRKFS